MLGCSPWQCSSGAEDRQPDFICHRGWKLNLGLGHACAGLLRCLCSSGSYLLSIPQCLPSKNIHYGSRIQKGQAGSFLLVSIQEARGCISWGERPLTISWKNPRQFLALTLSELPGAVQSNRASNQYPMTSSPLWSSFFSLFFFFWSNQTKTKHLPTLSLGMFYIRRSNCEGI